MSDNKSSKKKWLLPIGGLAALGIVAFAVSKNGQPRIEDTSGGPLPGITRAESQKFYEARKLFTHAYTIDEGLGPHFNAQSCYQCHGSPGTIGGAGTDSSIDSLVHIGMRVPGSKVALEPLKKVIGTLSKGDVEFFDNHGGPILKKLTITKELSKAIAAGCQYPVTGIPAGCEFIAPRQAPTLLGSGLINAIDEDDLTELEDIQVNQNVDMAGRVVEHRDPLTQDLRLGRFGWKDQDTSLLAAVSSMLNDGIGITSSMHPDMGTAGGINDVPRCLMPLLPSEPNDSGANQVKLTYYLSLTAPPPRGPITPEVQKGEQLFEKLQCAFCHVPELRTKEKVNVVSPDSPVPQMAYMEIEALENQPVRAYSDFLLHNMGNKMADGIPQGKARAGEWRTPPLWGLRSRKFYLHDGSAKDLNQAIKAHSGQAKPTSDAYSQLPDADKKALMAFLQSL